MKIKHGGFKRNKRTRVGGGRFIPLYWETVVEAVVAAQNRRHFAAWLGLTPKEHSTDGRQRLGGISRAGNERLRQLLVLGATAVIRFTKPGSKTASAWLLALLERKPRKLAAVALANKMARIVWAMMATGEAYRGSKTVATPAAGAAAAA
jgi:hypothetical protein